jgi:erythromycin esterase-like protein
MARPRKQESIEKKILDVETRVASLKKEYEEALSQLKGLREQQRLVQAQRLLDAMDKKGKSFEEVLRLVNL